MRFLLAKGANVNARVWADGGPNQRRGEWRTALLMARRYGHEEVARILLAAGFFLFVPPALNEKAIEAAGLTLLRCEDRTSVTAEIAKRWHAARLRRAAVLQHEEGADWFGQRQRFLTFSLRRREASCSGVSPWCACSGR